MIKPEQLQHTFIDRLRPKYQQIVTVFADTIFYFLYKWCDSVWKIYIKSSPGCLLLTSSLNPSQVLQDMQQFAKAEEHFDNAIRLEPQNPVHRVYKGYASLECTRICWLAHFDIIVENFASSRFLPVFLKRIQARKLFAALFDRLSRVSILFLACPSF